MNIIQFLIILLTAFLAGKIGFDIGFEHYDPKSDNPIIQVLPLVIASFSFAVVIIIFSLVF